MASPPRCAHAIVGGSGTAAITFPEDLDDERVRVLQSSITVTTPFGDTPPLKHVSVSTGDGADREALVAPMHGWRPERSRTDAALALFWTLREAGVRRVVAETGAGSITQNFRPRDLVLPHDFIDVTPQVGGRLDQSHRVLMRSPFCPEVRAAFWRHATAMAADKATRAFDRAVHVATQGPRFETSAEVAAFARMGGDIVGQAVAPEVYLAREIGACYATLAVVLNYAEGVRPSWDYELLEEIVRDDARSVGRLLLEALVDIPETPSCACASARKRVPGSDVLMDTA